MITMVYHYRRLQLLPPVWDSPRTTIKKLIEKWFIEIKTEKILP